MTDFIENKEQYDKDHLLFHQYSSPPHYALIVRQNVEQYFPQDWIGSMNWHLRSPDLLSHDFFLGGTKKVKSIEGN